MEDYFDLSQPVWLVAVEFDLRSHVERMMHLHPGWSNRQARCVLYWQGGVNKELEDLARCFARSVGRGYTLCPEAMGVQVIKTASRAGVPIKPRPVDLVHKIALIGETRMVE